MSKAYEGQKEGNGPVSVIAYDAIDSTNSEALRQAAKGERGPLWLRAGQQLAGKGRSGRTWNSPSGNLSATLLFAPGCQLEALHHLSLIAGIAVYDAVASAFQVASIVLPGGIRLKWPNDVMIDDAKLAGILIETSVFDGRIVAAIGCGLNITTAPPLPSRQVTRLADYGLRITAPELLQTLSTAMLRWLGTWDEGRNFAAIRLAWLERAGPIGAPITINTGDGRVAGHFAGLDPEGALLMADPAGNVRRFHYGDVSYAVPPGADRPEETE